MNPELDNFLDSVIDTDSENIQEELDSLDLDTSKSFLDSPVPVSTIVTLQAGQIDPRLQLLSHSSRTSLHKCPRKYQLYRLSSSTVALEATKEMEQGVTFAYGKVVGIGIQSTLEGKTEAQIYMDCLLEWDVDLLDSNSRQKKSFWEALFAVQKFIVSYEAGYLQDYELVYYQGKPAVELSFRVTLPDGYKYRGYVDGVLRHKGTGEILVLECKTTSGTANSTTYKNSGQAIGYSIVLDKMFPELSSYKVFYLVYESRTKEYVEFFFEKSLLQRALWLQELIIDTKHISLYEEYNTYPMHGENCLDFFRDCEYLGICTLTTENITKPLTEKILEEIEAEEYMFEVDFMELVEAQLKKGSESYEEGEE